MPSPSSTSEKLGKSIERYLKDPDPENYERLLQTLGRVYSEKTPLFFCVVAMHPKIVTGLLCCTWAPLTQDLTIALSFPLQQPKRDRTPAGKQKQTFPAQAFHSLPSGKTSSVSPKSRRL